MNDRVVIHLDSEGVADVRLNRADKMNAIDSAMIEGILAAQDRLRAEPRLRAVVLHGEGRAFCAGLDISRFRSMGPEKNGRGYTLADRTHGIANAPQQMNQMPTGHEPRSDILRATRLSRVLWPRPLRLSHNLPVALSCREFTIA